MHPCGIAALPPMVHSTGLITDVFFGNSSHNHTQQDVSPSPRTKNHSSYNQVSSVTDLRHVLSTLADHKAAVTARYLQLIEDTVDDFLARVIGVHTRALSDRYLDEPPKNMQLLKKNQDLLVHCTQDAFNPNSEVNTQLLSPLVGRIYSEFLTPLRQELLSAWNGCAMRFSAIDDAAIVDPRTKGKCLGVYQDIEHIDQMAELDKLSAYEMTEKCKTLSHVVPVSGLALGRIHRMLNEHNTAIQHWSASRKR